MNEFPFMLPVGLVTSDGRIHRSGTMRSAVALDEIEPLGDERVKRNEAYYTLLVLSRVVTRLGPFAPLTPEVLAALPAADFAYLQDLYSSVNATTGQLAPVVPAAAQTAVTQTNVVQKNPPQVLETECPHCGAVLELDLSTA